MTSGAIDDWIRAFQILDFLELIAVDDGHHRIHITRDLFGRFIFFVPGAATWQCAQLTPSDRA